jgi:hypothetical protein
MKQIKTTRLVGFVAPIEFAEALKFKSKQERRSMASYMKKVLSDSMEYGGDL